MHTVRLRVELTPRHGEIAALVLESCTLSNSAPIKVVKISPKKFCLKGRNEIYLSMEKTVNGKSISARLWKEPGDGEEVRVLYLHMLLPPMYVCTYRGCPLWNCQLLQAVQLGLGEGLIGIVGPMSQPHSTVCTTSLTLDHTRALNVHFLNTLGS